jgi:hypothetical protein
MTTELNPDQPAPPNPTLLHPEAEPPEAAKGLPRLVLEARCHLGPTATPDEVVAELRRHGVETSPEQVRQVWPADALPR